MRVGLTYDLRSDWLALGHSVEEVAEFDTEETIDYLEAAIRALGHATDRIGNARSLCQRLVAGDRWDLVFNIAEGMHGRGREALVPSLLELHGIGYTFADPLACATTLDKAVAKRLVREAGLPTPAFRVVREEDDLRDIGSWGLRWPLFAKPVAEGTGKGIATTSRAETPAQLGAYCRDALARLRQPVLVEEYLPGREFTVGVLGNGASARAIGGMEVVFLKPGEPTIYSFATKHDYDGLVDYAFIDPPGLRAKVEALAVAAFRTLECRDCARADIRLDPGGAPSFLEINPLPGLNAVHSDLPLLARMHGMQFGELIAGIVGAACARLEIRP